MTASELLILDPVMGGPREVIPLEPMRSSYRLPAAVWALSENRSVLAIGRGDTVRLLPIRAP